MKVENRKQLRLVNKIKNHNSSSNIRLIMKWENNYYNNHFSCNKYFRLITQRLMQCL